VHGTFARCKDGVKVYTYKTTGASKAPKKARASKRKVEAAIGSAPGAPASADLRSEMAAVVVADEQGKAEEVPAGFAKVNGILVPTDPAKIAEIMEDNRRYALAAEHEAAEKALGMMLPVPKELRRPNTKGADALLSQIGEVRKKQQEYQTKDVTIDQALATSGLIKDVMEARQKREADAANAPKPEAQRAPGDYPWRCCEPKCGTKFRSLSIEGMRRKAQAEPGFRPCCPECGSVRIIQAEVVEGAA
jgi:hypothetical protein